MKWIKPACVFILLFGVAVSSAAWANGSHGSFGHGGGSFGHAGGHFGGGHFAHTRTHVGVFVGGPVFWPWYYPAPTYYYPPVVVAPASPPVYIQQGDANNQPAPDNWWYYCSNPAGYYPYIEQCSTAWQRVAPRPQP